MKGAAYPIALRLTGKRAKAEGPGDPTVFERGERGKGDGSELSCTPGARGG